MKYNWSIIGHEKQLKQIERDLMSGNLAHAYLLAGPNSIGKFTVARKMAGILQCEKDFCHTCPTCLQIQKGGHMDTIEMAESGESIKIEDVRKLIDRLNMTSNSKYKLLLIKGLERMTIEATNAFLKILEEPPDRTIFILTTDNIKSLLPTIISRVRVVKFQHLSAGFLEEKMKELFPNQDDETRTKVGLFAMGKSGKAMSLMENPEVLSEHMKIYNDVQGFLEHGTVYDRFIYAEDLLADNKKMETFLSILTSVLRTKILEHEEGREENIKTLSKIDEAGILLKKNVNNRLVIENLMLSLCGHI